ncbi:MAG: glycosyl hydrolase family 18 protein, partial [Candidatus Dormibacteraceae bacterium]
MQPDPLTGPHVVQDAQHSSDRLNFTPAGNTAALPLLATMRGLSAPHAALSTQKREIFGFAPYWTLSKNAEWNYNLLSTVSYFGLDVNSDGHISNTGNGWNGFASTDFTNVVNNAHRAGTKVVVTIKNFDDGSINTVDTSSILRQILINDVISVMQSKSLDGVNVDFEAVETANFPDLQAGITTLMTELTAAVHGKWPQSEVSIDTYAGSASWDQGVFKIGDLAPVVDAMFIMNYDSAFSNMPGQAGPNSPMTHWTYNDTVDVAQYLTKAPASKIILGVPYYGYRWSTTSGAPYATTVGTKPIAEGYSAAMDDLACAHPALTRGWDAWGESPWAAWWSPSSNDPCGDNFGYPQELYYDDATSLGLKYDLVNSSNLRGVGMWALGMDSGRTELWSALSTYFSCPVSVTAPAAPVTTEFGISLSAGSCAVAYYDVKEYDATTNQGWFLLPGLTPSNPTELVEGYPGHTYQFQARAHTTAGLVSSWATATSAVAPAATSSHAFKGLYTLDAYGGVNANDSPPLAGTAYWPNWKIACAAKAQ